jgi:hypothetical protein
MKMIVLRYMKLNAVQYMKLSAVKYMKGCCTVHETELYDT